MKLSSLLLDLLYPRKCPFCQHLVEGDALLCPDCQRTLPWLTEQAAERTPEFVRLCVSPLRYRGPVADSIHRYKFSGRRSYSHAYGMLMAQCVKDHFTQPFDVITWAPLSKKRLKQRGYDQAELLARSIGESLGLEAVPLLVKARDIPAQSGIQEEAARRANVLGAYALLPGAEVKGKRILLADDVVTSGSTLSECARTLLSSGAAEVCAVTLAQAGKLR